MSKPFLNKSMIDVVKAAKAGTYPVKTDTGLIATIEGISVLEDKLALINEQNQLIIANLIEISSKLTELINKP